MPFTVLGGYICDLLLYCWAGGWRVCKRMHVFRFNVCRSRISESSASPDGLPTVHTTHTITFLIYSQLNTFSLPLHSHARAHAFVERERVFHIVCLLQVASVRRLFVDEMARVYEESGDDFEPSPDLKTTIAQIAGDDDSGHARKKTKKHGPTPTPTPPPPPPPRPPPRPPVPPCRGSRP